MFRFYWMLTVLLLIFVLSVTSSYAQDKNAESNEPAQASGQNLLFETMFDEGGHALLERRYPEAEKKLKAALREAEQFPPSDPRLQQTIQTLAELYDEEKKFELSEPLYRRMLDNDAKTNSTKKRTMAGDYDRLASNLQRQSKYEEAISFYLKAKDLFAQADKEGIETSASSDSQQLNTMKVENRVVSLIRLASAYSDLGKLTDCEKSLREALAVAESSNDAIAAGRAFDALGRHYTSAGRYDEAEAVLNQAQAQKKKIQDVGIRRLEISNTLLLYGQLFRAQGKINDALQSIELSNKMRAGSLEQNDPRLYEPLLAKAAIYRDLACYKDAAAELEKGRALVEKSFGDENPRYAEFLRQLASDYVSCSQYAKADPLLRKALAIDEEAYGKDARQVCLDLDAMGMYFIYQGKYADAEPVYKRALEISQKSGAESLDVAAAFNNLAWLYTNQRKFDEAIPLLENGLAIRRKVYGDEHPVVARNMHNLATVLISQQKFDQAQAMLTRAYKIQKSVLGIDHEDTIATMRDLAPLLSNAGKSSESEEYYRAILKADQKDGDTASAIMVADMNSLAKVLLDTSRDEEAKELLAKAREMKLKLPGYSEGNQGHAITLGAPKAAAASVKPVADKWALVVGISSFKDSAINLQFAAKDAMDFRNYLIFEANFKPDHVKLLLDEHATRDNIVSHLGDKWLRKNAKADDMVVIYISTHGTSARKDVGNANFIVAYETNLNNAVLSGIPMQFFTAGVRDMIPSERVVIIMDVCHGGAVRENTLASAISTKEKEVHAAQSGSKAIILQPDMSVRASGTAGAGGVNIGTGQIVVASSDADQVSWESKHYPNGVFTRQLIEALRTRGQNTSVQEAYKIMRTKVEQEVLRSRAEIQTPILASNSWHGAEAVLSVKPAAPRNVIGAAPVAATAPTKTPSKKR